MVKEVASQRPNENSPVTATTTATVLAQAIVNERPESR